MVLARFSAGPARGRHVAPAVFGGITLRHLRLSPAAAAIARAEWDDLRTLALVRQPVDWHALMDDVTDPLFPEAACR